MREIKIQIARFGKRLMLMFRIHIFLSPFENIFINLAYVSKMSRFAHQNKNSDALNDFLVLDFKYDRREIAYKYFIDNYVKNTDINYLEFGVCSGKSFEWWINHHKNSNSTFNGFDTFEGLPEDWGPFKKGDMSTSNKIPEYNDIRTKFHQGLFQVTLPKFLESFNDDKKKVIHLDADLYSSTLYVLTTIAPLLKKGDIVIFDEFGVPSHEFMAFHEFINVYYKEFKLIAAQNNYYFAAFKIE